MDKFHPAKAFFYKNLSYESFVLIVDQFFAKVNFPNFQNTTWH